MKDVRIELKLRNNLVLTRMEELGIKTVAELTRRAGLKRESGVGAIINMKSSPFTDASDPAAPKWKAVVIKIAKALASEPEELFSEALQQTRIDPITKLHLEVSVDDIRRLSARGSRYLLADANPEQDLQIKEVEGALKDALQTLTPREGEVIKLRFGLEGNNECTLAEVAPLLNVTGEMVRKIEARALRKLRHPTRARPIRNAGLTEYLARRAK
jgi:RNA polymerase sigma factor (sigma-70 family)